MIYTTGTIAISGNTLTGTGTNFTAAGSLIRNGCTVIAMTSPVQVFQITTIGSATSLTVTPAANPAIPAGTKYAILLSDSLSVDGLAQDIAETFTMYQRYMSGFADVMNGTTDVTITINGVPVTVPGQKSLAKKGANSDITSLSGLTTALSISQGGTGAKNAADARANLGLRSAALADILGTVSQTGGVPTGAVIEKGSNSNGEYVRFADGTQICRMVVSAADAENKNVTIAGTLGGYRSSQNPVPFPANFAAPAYCSGHINNNGLNVRIELVSGNQASCQFAFHAINSGTYAGADTIYITAIGRWF
ncbi:hypothetical protein [Enterobacter kobei]|uniref:hypothetical protein n=1 Tax=Enterobacter kobei TaxID=208224 RepID=UPI001FD4E1DF|nr:hypothetical protein [Enterobacter kobei]